MGLKVTARKVEGAAEALYPEGLAQLPSDGTLIRDFFKYFERGL
jgi:hypothetical protein